MKCAQTPVTIIKTKTMIPMISTQKYDLAKFRRLTFLVPPRENTIRRINPIRGIEKRIWYPKYPHMEIGLISSGRFVISSLVIAVSFL